MMVLCMMCGQHVEAGDTVHDKEETPAHLRGWREAWSWALNSSNPQEVAKAKRAISIIDEKLARLDLA